jgi:hypothetical protein
MDAERGVVARRGERGHPFEHARHFDKVGTPYVLRPRCIPSTCQLADGTSAKQARNDSGLAAKVV